jgi:UDP-GlcNAc:undecaprenyl-phosphate/decaprenyl-phosphate GlcNAc-1-phosphate transferase
MSFPEEFLGQAHWHWWLVPLSGVLAALLAHLLTPVAIRIAGLYGLVDRPDGKLKRQSEPVAYLGGAAVYLAYVIALGLTYEFSREVLALLLAGTMVVLLGLVDDIGAISPRAKFLGQALAALVLIKAGIAIDIVWLPTFLDLLLSLVWLIGVMNAVNLIDIMDGLASGVCLIGALALLAVAALNGNYQIAILTATLAGALAGFVRHNFQPARIYLGDTGSLFIGLNLGALAMIGRYTEQSQIGLLAPLVILGVPVFDTLFVMYVRRRRGVSMFLGSPDHVALRLRRWRLSVRQTVAVSYATSALLGAAGVAVMLLDQRGALGVLGALAALGLGFALWLKRIDMGL